MQAVIRVALSAQSFVSQREAKVRCRNDVQTQHREHFVVLSYPAQARLPDFTGAEESKMLQMILRW